MKVSIVDFVQEFIITSTKQLGITNIHPIKCESVHINDDCEHDALSFTLTCEQAEANLLYYILPEHWGIYKCIKESKRIGESMVRVVYHFPR